MALSRVSSFLFCHDLTSIFALLVGLDDLVLAEFAQINACCLASYERVFAGLIPEHPRLILYEPLLAGRNLEKERCNRQLQGEKATFLHSETTMD